MAKRTVTSKGLRVKVRALNKANETLGAELKITRIALGRAKDIINQLEGKLAVIATSGTEEVQVDAVIAAAKETGRGQSDRNTEGTQ